MIETLSIKNFKALKDEKLDLSGLSVITGENSSGKSTALLAYLLTFFPSFLAQDITKYISQRMKNSLHFLERPDASFEVKLSNTTNMVNVTGTGPTYTMVGGTTNTKSLIFLCADRIAPQQSYETDATDNEIGIRGEYAPYCFQKNKYKMLAKEMCKDTENFSLETQVNYWLQHILQTAVKSEEVADLVVVRYEREGEPQYLPHETGFGTSLVLPILVACLSRNKGDVVIIENPEIHLHPKAQAALADFFAFVASAGIQLIIETHCEHLIYKLCYNVNQKVLTKDQLIFHYKEKSTPFEHIYVDEKGRFLDEKGEQTGFPNGFFDATVNNYLEVYR